MTRVLVAVAALALGASGAYACPSHQSAELDTQTVASVEATKRIPMSTPQDMAPADGTAQQAPAQSVD